MNTRPSITVVRICALVALLLVVNGCSSLSTATQESASFSKVKPVLEANCVHCHGENRLVQMPPFGDTKLLGSLIGPSNWIVPGKPESSRFFHVVTFPDTTPGAMPPTGHAITKADVAIIRTWIETGAELPKGKTVVLQPRGEVPRSR